MTEGGSSKVDATTSPRTERCISVTSSGRSSINRTIKIVSGLLATIDWAMFCITSVLPAFGGETISARWPLSTGATRSMIRAVKSVLPFPRSSCRRSFGNSGVRFSNKTFMSFVVGFAEIYFVDFKQCKVTLSVLWRADLASNGVASTEVKSTHLA